MPRALYPRLVCLVGLLTLGVAGSAAPAPSGARPNLLVFISDDESWLERGIYGWNRVPTPHFDRVARAGALFTRGYASAPSCAPARAALLTGRNFWELEQGAFIQAWIPAKFPCLPDLLEQAGYHAGFTGKGWGPGVLGAPSDRTRNPAGKAYSARRRPAPGPGMSVVDYAGNLEAFLDARPEGRPFWFWVGVTEPHSPWAEDNHRRLAAETGLTPEQLPVPGFLPDTPGLRRTRANMMQEMRQADDDLGRVLAVLERRGELENTLVIVTADNGTGMARAKTNVHDWGIHVPLAIAWPRGMPGGRVIDDFVNFIDLGPTMLEAAGVSIPREMTGRSLVSVLASGRSGRVDPARGSTVAGLEWHGEEPELSLAARTIREERYQYIVNYSATPRLRLDPRERRPDSDYASSAAAVDELALIARHPEHPLVRGFTHLYVAPRPPEELYDTQEDPWQLRNLAADPALAVVKARLRAQLEDYQRRTRDPRITGELGVFDATRAFVLERKFGAQGYAQRKRGQD